MATLFRTPVSNLDTGFRLHENNKVLALGSCFAHVIGQRLKDRKVDIVLNPLGVMYNPKSIFTALDMAVGIAEGETDAEVLSESLVFEGTDGVWYSWMAASLIHGRSREDCIRNMAEALQMLAKRITDMDVLMLTFGTDHYYNLKIAGNNELVVANCHKMPGNLFAEHIMSHHDITGLFATTYNKLTRICPTFEIVVSVSPYRYIKYGMHGSQLSKARLLLAIDDIQKNFKDIHYFPAYEILNDELRDYRFYAADMVHPSEVAEEYIWQLFCTNFVDQNLNELMVKRERELKAQNHRPHNKQ